MPVEAGMAVGRWLRESREDLGLCVDGAHGKPGGMSESGYNAEG